MPSIRDTVIQFLQQIRGTGETGPQPRGAEGAMPRLVLSPGTEVLATVMGKFDDGTSLVRISSHLFAMELPSRFQSGDSVRLTFLNQDARPTFALANQTLSGTPVTLSPAGQLVKRIMSDPAPDVGTSKSGLPVMERLLDGPPTDTARLAGRLRQALGESGFFYESHLKEWAMGERPMAEVLREPQAALSRPETGAPASDTPLPDRPVAGNMPSEPAVSRMPTEEEAPDAAAPSPREKQPAESRNREPAPAGTRVQDGEIRTDGRSESGKSLPLPESTSRDAEGGADDAAIPTSPDRRRVETAAQEPPRTANARENRDGTPVPEKQTAESVVKEPGRPMGGMENNDGIPVLREDGGRSVRAAASEHRDVSAAPPDGPRQDPATERSATSPLVREQGSPRQEAPEKPSATPGTPIATGDERIPGATDTAQKAPAAAEQRARLLKETYGRLDPALVNRDAQDIPADTPRAEMERNTGISRSGPAGMRMEVNQEALPTATISMPTLTPVEEWEGKEASPVPPPLQGEIADARTLPLVRQQLNLLTSGVFLWQGEAWPGQPMEWKVEDREARPDQGEERGRRTTLRLDLPNLGRVSAVITLEGKDLNLSLSAGSSDSASLLGERTGDLKNRLSAAGIEMKGVVVRHEELEGA